MPHSDMFTLISIADRYRPLTSFSQKLRFVIDIQIAIFDKLHERFQSNLEAYLSMTTSFGRAVGGVTKEEQSKLLGVDGLERLCKTHGSADYLEKAMRDWSDDVVSALTLPIGTTLPATNAYASFSWTFGTSCKIVLAKLATSGT
jgi:hypothetical protein